MLYPINEIFYSIQCEGFHTGIPAVFIRLAGCNLHCSWCDTDYSEKRGMTEKEIVLEANAIYRARDYSLIVITGGEPTIHDLGPLLRELETETSAIIAMETNGTKSQMLWWLKELGLVDWITISPKKATSLLSLKYANEIKVVFDGKINPMDYAHSLMQKEPYLYIQPCSENFKPAVDYVLEHPQWRLSVQTQKIIGIK